MMSAGPRRKRTAGRRLALLLRKPGGPNSWARPEPGSRVPVVLVQDRAPDRRAAVTQRPTPAAGIQSPAVMSRPSRVGGDDRSNGEIRGRQGNATEPDG